MAKGQKEVVAAKSEDRGVVVPANKRVPYDPKNIQRSKAEFVKFQQETREKEAKLRAYEATLDKGVAVETPAEPEERIASDAASPEKPSKHYRGRPKRID